MERSLAKKIKKIFSVAGSVFLFFIFSSAAAQAATLYFSPSSGTHTVGNILTTSFYVNTQDQAINNSDAVINFPPNLLEVVSVSKSGSIFSTWVEEPSFSNGAGTISFIGGLPTPGYTGAGGKIISIVFRLKEAGTASVVCSSASVRANDGFGTDVLQGCGQAKFTLVPKEAAPTPPPAAPVSGVPGAPVVTSSTHPNPTRWYSNNNPVFSWALPAGVTGVNVLADHNPTQDPGTRSDGRFATYDYKDVEEGRWFFHIRFQNENGWGPVAHFAFNIDRTPPTLPTESLMKQPTVEDPQGSIVFESQDSLSGVASYAVSVDGVESDPVNSTDISADRPYQLPTPIAGTHTVSVVAYDHAGNASPVGTFSYVVPVTTIAEAPICAVATLGPWVVNSWINFWMLWLLLALILLLIILCLWLWRTHRLSEFGGVEARTATRMLERTLANLERQLRRLERTHSRRPLTDAETSIYRAIRGQTHDIVRSIGTLKGHTNPVPMLDAAAPMKKPRRKPKSFT